MRQIAVRKTDDLLDVTALMRRGNEGCIGNYVINIVGAHRPRVPEIVHLDWRRAASKYFGASILSEAVQIDQYIDLFFSYSFCDFIGAEFRRINELVKRMLQASTDL